MKKAEKLIQDIDNKIRDWDEYSQFKLKGVGNLSVSDMDRLKLYAETYIRNGGNFRGLMTPLGDNAKILKAYGLSWVEGW